MQMPNNLQMVDNGYVVATINDRNPDFNNDMFTLLLGSEEYICFPPVIDVPYWSFKDPATNEYHNFERMSDMLDAVCKDAIDYAGA